MIMKLLIFKELYWIEAHTSSVFSMFEIQLYERAFSIYVIRNFPDSHDDTFYGVQYSSTVTLFNCMNLIKVV